MLLWAIVVAIFYVIPQIVFRSTSFLVKQDVDLISFVLIGNGYLICLLSYDNFMMLFVLIFMTIMYIIYRFNGMSWTINSDADTLIHLVQDSEEFAGLEIKKVVDVTYMELSDDVRLSIEESAVGNTASIILRTRVAKRWKYANQLSTIWQTYRKSRRLIFGIRELLIVFMTINLNL